MIAYCIRQVSRGLFNLLLTSFILFTLLTYGPSGAWEQLEKYPEEIRPGSTILQYAHIDFEHMRASWPQSYLIWLFDPLDSQDFDYECYCVVRRGIDLRLGEMHIRGSGALTGHLGASTHLASGQPVLSDFLIGHGALMLFGTMSWLIAISMLLAMKRRWLRQNYFYVSAAPESHVITWHYFSFPPPLIGWYKRDTLLNVRPTFRLY